MKYVIEHNRSAVAIHDRELHYLYVSKQYLEQFNVREENIIGKHHYDVFSDLPQKWREVHKRALAGEVVNAEDDPYEREDGTVDWTRWECRPWYEADGSIGGIIVYTEVIREKKKTELELENHNQILFQLLDVANRLTIAHDFDTVVNIIRDAARTLSRADGVTFVLRDGDQCYYRDEDAIEPLWKGKRFPLDQCISGWVMRKGESVAIEDVYQDPRIPHDVYRKTFVKSLAMAPFSSKAAIGAIGAYWKEKHVVTDIEKSLLNILAKMAASVWEAIEFKKSITS